ncbi:MAG: serine--tRNA ligase [Patescibacteria group bacterium]
MLDIKFIAENLDQFKKAAETKGIKADLSKVPDLSKRRSKLIQEVEKLRSEQKALQGEEAKEKGPALKVEIQKIEPELKKVEEELGKILQVLPNIPKEDVKKGASEEENEVIRAVGEKRKFDFEPKDSADIGKDLGIIDTERGAKVSGSRFGYLKGDGALLEFALIQYAMSVLTKEGFEPIVPPVMISDESMDAMGYLIHGGDEESYHFKKDNLYLVGTSEQSVGPFHMNEILEADRLPLRYAGFSTCFRREAGSYGKDTKGIFRVHQFDKIEMFSFTHPDKSDKEHEFLLGLEEKLTQGLGLHYQVVKMCTGDLGIPAARKYDIECWFPFQKRYRETHSTSTCTDYQARRLNIRYKNPKTGKNEHVHMLNGTAFAIGRTILAILENYQKKNGSVEIPEVLRPFMFGKEKIG